MAINTEHASHLKYNRATGNVEYYLTGYCKVDEDGVENPLLQERTLEEFLNVLGVDDSALDHVLYQWRSV